MYIYIIINICVCLIIFFCDPYTFYYTNIFSFGTFFSFNLDLKYLMSFHESTHAGATVSSRIDYSSLNETNLYKYSQDITSVENTELMQRWNDQTNYIIYNIIRWIIIIIVIMILHYEIHYDIDSNTYEQYCCSCLNVVTGTIDINDSYYNANEYFMDWSICDDCSCKYCMNRNVSSVAVCDIQSESDYDLSDCKETRKETFGFIVKKNWDVFQSIVIPVAVTALYIIFMVICTICRTVDDNNLHTWDVIRVTSLVLTFYNILSSVFCHFGLFLRFILHMKTISTKNGINPQCLVSPVKILPIMIVEVLIMYVLFYPDFV